MRGFWEQCSCVGGVCDLGLSENRWITYAVLAVLTTGFMGFLLYTFGGWKSFLYGEAVIVVEQSGLLGVDYAFFDEGE